MTKEEKRSAYTVFDEVYLHNKDSIYRYCLSRLRCDIGSAEDCTEEVFIVYWKRIQSGEEIGNPKAFLYRTAKYLTLKFSEKNKRRQTQELSVDDEEKTLAVADSAEVDESIRLKEMQAHLEKVLSEKEKQLYEMYFVNDMKIAEIAEVLQIRPHTCTVRISRLRSKIKDELEEFF